MSPVGIAVIGASKRSTMVINYLKNHPDVGSITGIYDVVPQAAELYVNHFELADAKIYSSLDECVNDPDAAAVFIGSTDGAHREPVEKSLAVGKHVYCEKPMAITLENCDAIIDAAQAASSVFYLGMNLRHNPVHELLHNIMTSGELGRILTIEANEYYYGGRTYFRRWNRLRKYGGGLWITKASHDFDLLNWFSQGRATRVYATCSLSHYKTIEGAGPNCRVCAIKDTCKDFYDINNADNALWDKQAAVHEKVSGVPRDICLFNSDKDTFDNGIAVVDFANDVRATYTCNVVSARDTRQMRLMGTDGAAEGDVSSGLVTVWKRHCDEKRTIDVSEQMKSGHGGADDRIMADFFRCCVTGDNPRSSWADGRASLELGLAATESCDKGAPITLGQDRADLRK